MMFTSKSATKRSLVLYHAISSYQLLEVMLHRRLYHPSDEAVLLLPDFIVKKYPQYQDLQSQGFFDHVYLFPYQQIPHQNEHQVLRDTARAYRRLVPYRLRRFSRIYIAGAHFYFTLYVLQKRLPFYFFEDAADMLPHARQLYSSLHRRFPLHADLARKYGLFSGHHPLVQAIICHVDAGRQAPLSTSDDLSQSTHCPLFHFSVEDALCRLGDERQRFVRFFVPHTISTEASAILLTQHFAGLGAMLWPEQEALYRRAAVRLQEERLLVKRHPDDALDYRVIFPDAQILKEVFPAELLPYVFDHRPLRVYTFSSTGCENLRRHFTICYL